MYSSIVFLIMATMMKLMLMIKKVNYRCTFYNTELNNLHGKILFQFEFAKSRSMHAYVPTCLRDCMVYMPACQ